MSPSTASPSVGARYLYTLTGQRKHIAELPVRPILVYGAEATLCGKWAHGEEWWRRRWGGATTTQLATILARPLCGNCTRTRLANT